MVLFGVGSMSFGVDSSHRGWILPAHRRVEAGGALPGCGVGVEPAAMKSRRWRDGDSFNPGNCPDTMMAKHVSVLEMTMANQAIRSTFYLEPDLHRALRRKAATAHRSMSAIVNDAVRESLREEEEDLAVFSGRAKEKPMSYEQFLANWNAQ